MNEDRLTLRDEIAIKILPAIYTDFWQVARAKGSETVSWWEKRIAEEAYSLADAMLEVRDTPKRC